jgi:hypothetical protein
MKNYNNLQFSTIQDVVSYMNENHFSLSDMIEIIRNSNNVNLPEYPHKPHLDSKHSSYDVLKYAEDLKQYEIDIKKYNAEHIKYRNENYRLNNLIKELVCIEASLDTVPEKYREKVYSYAYEHSHSTGYYEVYLTLCNLVDIFE